MKNGQKTCQLPVMQQVQLLIGVFLLLGLALSLFVSPWFVLVSGFIGCGMLMAGSTGVCPMENALKKAPWNAGCVCASAEKTGSLRLKK